MMTPTPSSTFISAISYRRGGFLAVFFRPTATRPLGGAVLYGDVPSWVPGLVLAGTARRSVGLAYNRLVKGKFASMVIEGGTQDMADLMKIMGVPIEFIAADKAQVGMTVAIAAYLMSTVKTSLVAAGIQERYAFGRLHGEAAQ